MAVSGALLTVRVHDGAAWQTIAASKTLTFTLETEEIDTTTKDSSLWKEAINGSRSWSADFDGLLVEDHTTWTLLRNAYLNGTKLWVSVRTPAAHIFDGYGILTSLSIEGPQSDALSLSGSFSSAATMAYT